MGTYPIQSRFHHISSRNASFRTRPRPLRIPLQTRSTYASHPCNALPYLQLRPPKSVSPSPRHASNLTSPRNHPPSRCRYTNLPQSRLSPAWYVCIPPRHDCRCTRLSPRNLRSTKAKRIACPGYSTSTIQSTTAHSGTGKIGTSTPITISYAYQS